MIFDRQTLFSNAQGPFNTGTNASTDYLDLQVARDIGRGERLVLVICVTEQAAGGTTDIQLQTDDNSSFSTPTTVWSTGALAAAAITPGVIAVNIPRVAVPERYMRLAYVQASANQTTGKFTAGIVRDAQDWILYPKATYAQA